MDSEMRALVENYLLATSGLKKFFGQRTVVDGVSIYVKPGEIVGLLGPNGAGKTTTFNMVVGLVKPDEGDIYYRNQLVTSLPIHRRARLGVGYLTQEPSVFRKLTVRQNILAILETRKVPRGEMRHRMDHLLEELELTHVANSLAYQLSGGEKRRLEITRALVCNPQLFLLDEPFAGIDPLAVFEVQKIVRQLSQRGMGVLITDHNAREMLKLVDRAYILVQGRVLMEGTSSFLAESSQARDIYLGPDFN